MLRRRRPPVAAKHVPEPSPSQGSGVRTNPGATSTRGEARTGQVMASDSPSRTENRLSARRPEGDEDRLTSLFALTSSRSTLGSRHGGVNPFTRQKLTQDQEKFSAPQKATARSRATDSATGSSRLHRSGRPDHADRHGGRRGARLDRRPTPSRGRRPVGRGHIASVPGCRTFPDHDRSRCSRPSRTLHLAWRTDRRSGGCRESAGREAAASDGRVTNIRWIRPEVYGCQVVTSVKLSLAQAPLGDLSPDERPGREACRGQCAGQRGSRLVDVGRSVGCTPRHHPPEEQAMKISNLEC